MTRLQAFVERVTRLMADAAHDPDHPAARAVLEREVRAFASEIRAAQLKGAEYCDCAHYAESFLDENNS